MWLVLPAGLLGGLSGAILLLYTSDATFRKLIPYLILTAVILLAFQDRLRTIVAARMSGTGGTPREAGVVPLVFLAAVYGGSFGAGLGVMMLAILGLILDDTLTRLNALKQLLSFVINGAAAVFFLFSGKVLWITAAVMTVGSLAGGVLGGRVASRMKPAVLRWIVITVGLIVAIIYFVR